MKKIITLCLLIVMAFAFKAQATVHVILANNFFYAPSSITVNQGDTVRFTWVAGSHPTSSTTGDWALPLFFTLNSSSTTFDLVMNDAGTFDYQCDFHAGLGMIGTITVVGGCDASVAPQNPITTNGAASATLSWDAIPGTVACQVKGTRITPPGPSPSVNVMGSEPTSVNVPYAAAGAGTVWEWQSRCACSTSPLLVSPFSAVALLNIPSARTSEIDRTLSLFPNPNNGQVFAGFYAEGGEVNFTVLDLTGKVITSEVKEYQAGQQSEHFAFDLEPGLYFFQVVQGDKMSSSEFTVIK
ncbi:MAG: plastocyanin [Limisphaerales bacterium]|jgi:plastocyanin